jgi:hypothetical protein
LTRTPRYAVLAGTIVEEGSQDIEATIRAKLAAGELPRAKPEKVWAGKGTNQPCAGCGGTIARADVEYEIDLPGGPLRFHQNCIAIWDEQRLHPRASRSAT